MTTEPVLLPKEMATFIRKFLAEKKTGEITLNVKSGRIGSFEIHEHIQPLSTFDWKPE